MPSSVCRKFKGAPNRALWRGGWTLELAQFHVRTDRVRVLAETVSDPVRADTCDCLCRTVGEEAGFARALADLERVCRRAGIGATAGPASPSDRPEPSPPAGGQP